MNDKAQVSIDYIVGIILFLFGVSIIFYFAVNVISPVSQDSTKNQHMAVAISEFVVSYIHKEGVYKENVINTTALQNFLNLGQSGIYTLFGLNSTGDHFDVNITVKTLSYPRITIGSAGKPYYGAGNYGYVERIVVNSSNPADIYIIEVRVW